MNADLSNLQPYPFEKLAKLKAGITPAALSPISLAVGEPKHPTPQFIIDTLREHLGGLSLYPATRGSDELRTAIAAWLMRRFHLQTIDPQQQILPVNGTREALFAFAQCIIDRGPQARIVMPNPFYQIYEGAALLAGATPYFVNSLPETDYSPEWNLDPEIGRHVQLLYLCTPGNPTGKVLSIETLQHLIELADRYNFVIASDECYSEIYGNENDPPPGLLQAAAQMGRTDFKRCVVFHSLSKRSNVPGLRSGFVAGDAAIMRQFLLYRTYHGCAMSLPVQKASLAAWSDETHVVHNRRLYREKFVQTQAILEGATPIQLPDAGFYYWLATPTDDTTFSQALFREQNVTVLPGSYLSRPVQGIDPGRNQVRIALVPPQEECVEAAKRIKAFIQSGFLQQPL